MAHSRYGISSFVLSVTAGMFDMFMLTVIFILAAVGFPSTSFLIGIAGLLFQSTLILPILGIGLGITGLVQKNRNQLFSILGLLLNAILALILFCVVVFGLIVSAGA